MSSKARSIRDLRPIEMLLGLLLAFFAFMGPFPALAQGDTSKPLSIVVAFPPGGAMDTVGRTLAEHLGHRLNRAVIVDNRAGGNGAVANQHVRRQPADGTTLYVLATYFSTAPATDPAIHNYDPVKDFTPIARLTTNTTVLIARADAPYGTLQELLAYAAANPGKVSIGTTGVGANDHLSYVRFEKMGNVKLNMIHYKGAAAAAQDLMSGVLDIRMDSIASVRPALASGRVKLLALTTLARSPDMPDAPTVAETLTGFEMPSYFGVVAPGGMAPDLARSLSEHVAEVLKIPAVAQRFKGLGMEMAYQNPSEFSRYLSAHLKSQEQAVKDAGFQR